MHSSNIFAKTNITNFNNVPITTTVEEISHRKCIKFGQIQHKMETLILIGLTHLTNSVITIDEPMIPYHKLGNENGKNCVYKRI